ncbi:MAG: hypothetical protein WA624_15510, partial [Methylocella sp.]
AQCGLVGRRSAWGGVLAFRGDHLTAGLSTSAGDVLCPLYVDSGHLWRTLPWNLKREPAILTASARPPID